MRRIHSITLVVIAAFSLSHPASAMLIDRISGDFGIARVSDFMDEAQTDETPDDSTVRFTLNDNPAMHRWEWRAERYLSGSLDLTSGLDVTLESQLEVNLFKYPKGHPQAVQWIVILGANCGQIQFDDKSNMLRLVFEPVKPALTPSLDTSGFTSVMGVDFYYSGMKTDPSAVSFGPPIIIINALSDDVGWPAHPSSDRLRGFAWQVNGIAGNPVNADFILGGRFAADRGFDPNAARGFLDGDPTNHGFTATLPADPGFPINLGAAGEPFYRLGMTNIKFSARDFQVGVFPEPLRIENIEVVAEGVRLTWNAEPGKTYAVESGPALDQINQVEASGQSGPEYTDAGGPSDAAKFYRLREE